jgi:hypothetical protein
METGFKRSTLPPSQRFSSVSSAVQRGKGEKFVSDINSNVLGHPKGVTGGWLLTSSGGSQRAAISTHLSIFPPLVIWVLISTSVCCHILAFKLNINWRYYSKHNIQLNLKYLQLLKNNSTIYKTILFKDCTTAFHNMYISQQKYAIIKAIKYIKPIQ